MSKEDEGEEHSANEQLAEEEKAANSIVLPPSVCRLHPRGLIIAPGTSKELFDEIASALASATKQLAWYIADLCQQRIGQGHAGVYSWAERQGLGGAAGLRTKKMTALRFPLEWRTVRLPFTAHRLVATGLDGFPSEEELETAAGAEKATNWRRRAVEILDYAFAMRMTTKELAAYLRELQGQAVQPNLSFLQSLIKLLARVSAAPALLTALPHTSEVTALMTLLGGLLGQCLDLVNAFLARNTRQAGAEGKAAKGGPTIAPRSTSWGSRLATAAWIALVVVTGSGLGIGFFSYLHRPVALASVASPAWQPIAVAASAAAALPPPGVVVAGVAEGAPHPIRYARADLGAERGEEIGYINLTNQPDEDFLPNITITLVEDGAAAGATQRNF